MTDDLWQGYSFWTDDETAARMFERRYHRQPEKIVRTASSVLLGPISLQEHMAKAKGE